MTNHLRADFSPLFFEFSFFFKKKKRQLLCEQGGGMEDEVNSVAVEMY